MRKTDIFQAIKERRSIRRYTQEAVSRDDMLTLLEAGRWAPSGLDKQPYCFMAIFRGDARQEVLSQLTHCSRIIAEAGALAVVCLDKEKMYNAMKDHQGAGACIQNILLAAHGLGLGAVWIGQIVNRADEVLAALNLDSARYELMAVVAVGHPAEEAHVERHPLQDLLLETF
ncbi:MAG: nitroreductase [Pseudomonadota bacterium]